MMAGKPTRDTTSIASSRLWAKPERGTSSPIFSIACLKRVQTQGECWLLHSQEQQRKRLSLTSKLLELLVVSIFTAAPCTRSVSVC